MFARSVVSKANEGFQALPKVGRFFPSLHTNIVCHGFSRFTLAIMWELEDIKGRC